MKTASSDIVELLALCGLDFLVADAEHAPLDRRDVDLAALAARHRGVPLLVRIADRSPMHVQGALDSGATGLLVPHVMDGVDGAAVVASAVYRDGTRGYSNSPRAGDFGGRGLMALRASTDDTVCVVAQIEDARSLAHVDAIGRVERLDGILIGRADLAVSLGVDQLDHPDVDAAVRAVALACATAGKALGVFPPDARALAHFEALGATFFIVGSDQSMLRSQAIALAECFAGSRRSHPSSGAFS